MSLWRRTRLSLENKLGAKWLPKDEYRRIRELQANEWKAGDHARVDIGVYELEGGNVKALLSCDLGPNWLTVWLEPNILSTQDAWRELVAVAAWIIGLENQEAITVVQQAVSELGNEHNLTLTTDGSITYKRLECFEMKELQNVEF